MVNTIWVLLPPILVIIISCLTKDVYISLVTGVIIGCLMFTNFNFLSSLELFIDLLTSIISSNSALLIFLILLGIIVALITKSGASHAYAEAAKKYIKSRKSALLATTCLGILIFIDDYFNCLTVGTVMKPITDKYNVSRAKLAYIIDSTAAPVCILAPISSWAAAIAYSLPKGSTIDGYLLFLSTIPFNIYALLTLVFVFWIIFLDKDMFAMKKYHESLKNQEEVIVGDTIEEVGQGKVIDIILPIITLIITCITSMLYNGGFFSGASLVTALANCDSVYALVIGALITLILIFIFYTTRRILTFTQFTKSFTDGYKSMVEAIIILCLSWTLSEVCSAEYLNLGGYIASLLSSFSTVSKFMPVTFFIISLIVTISTGASWAAFAIFIPIIATIFPKEGTMLSLTISACLAGAVAGDHISPLSDTSVLSSAGAQCVHLTHVNTQLPYAMVVIAVTTIGYTIGGLLENGWIGLLSASICLLFFIVSVTLKLNKKS